MLIQLTTSTAIGIYCGWKAFFSNWLAPKYNLKHKRLKWRTIWVGAWKNFRNEGILQTNTNIDKFKNRRSKYVLIGHWWN